jgi:hypothetical protein
LSKRSIHQYQDLIVISLKLHHKQQQRSRQRSKRSLKIAGRLLGIGSIAAILAARMVQKGKDGKNDDAGEDIFAPTK